MTNFPTSPEALGPVELTRYLQAAGVLGEDRVTDARCELIGGGKMGDNARYFLSYGGAADQAPSTLVAKFPAADERARTMAGAAGAYYNEVMFYRVLAPKTSIRIPAVYGSEISADRGSFLLLLEDMAPAEPGIQTVGESRSHTATALREAVKLAAAFYGDSSLAGIDHVVGSTRGGENAEFAQLLLQDAWPGFVDRFGHVLDADGLAFGERYVNKFASAASSYEGVTTLVHGDFRSENILFHRDTATTVDWQTPAEANPLTDIAYFLGGSVEVDDRRLWERELVAGCRRQFAEAGVELGEAECWDMYRRAAMHGIIITVLGATFSSPDPRGDEMFSTMIRRHTQHCLDAGASEYLS
ncbi:MAG: phosphotransferase [Acidimicrobiaceae bacterium]|nr:phosphotransferase [Acidimicrobiaceae bacterium]MYL03680.1 phosphotransferase [Acidimicrobiaceae bacterium]